jgi:hypothetical protein
MDALCEALYSLQGSVKSYTLTLKRDLNILILAMRYPIARYFLLTKTEKIMEKVYWTMRNGQQIDVDLMDEKHLRNTLKMIIRNSKKQVIKPVTKEFKSNGEIAQEMHDNMIIEEIMGDMMDEWYGQ